MHNKNLVPTNSSITIIVMCIAGLESSKYTLPYWRSLSYWF